MSGTPSERVFVMATKTTGRGPQPRLRPERVLPNNIPDFTLTTTTNQEWRMQSKTRVNKLNSLCVK